MNKKMVIIMAAAGVLSFSGSFVVGWLTGGSSPSESGSNEVSAAGESGVVVDAGEDTVRLGQPGQDSVGIGGTGGDGTREALTERQLQELVQQVRGKIQEYDEKLAGLEQQEQRLQIIQDGINKDVEGLNSLRLELAAMVDRLKTERDKLLKSRLEIAATENANLKSIAAAYDKMDATSASKIVTSMCAGGGAGSKAGVFGGKNSNIADAVKILYFTTERTKAKLLAELVNSEPRLAALLCEHLKRIAEE